MGRLMMVLLALVGCGGGVRDEPTPAQGYDVEGLPRCSRLSALTAWQGSCDDGEACAWVPETSDGVCAPGCDTQDDCPDGSVCRHTDDGDGWARRWCAPHIPGPM